MLTLQSVNFAQLKNKRKQKYELKTLNPTEKHKKAKV